MIGLRNRSVARGVASERSRWKGLERRNRCPESQQNRKRTKRFSVGSYDASAALFDGGCWIGDRPVQRFEPAPGRNEPPSYSALPCYFSSWSVCLPVYGKTAPSSGDESHYRQLLHDSRSSISLTSSPLPNVPFALPRFSPELLAIVDAS